MVRPAPLVITQGENARLTCHVPRTNDFFMGCSRVTCRPRESGDPWYRLWNMGPQHKRVYARLRRAMRGDDASDDEPIQPDCVSLFQVLLEEIHGARPGGLGARAVEAPALVAMEAVLRVGVDVNLAVAA